VKVQHFSQITLLTCLVLSACNMNVGSIKQPVPVSGVRLYSESLLLVAGNETILSALVLPANADDKTLAWSSDNTDVVSVGEDGSLQAVAPGEATITVSAGGGAVTDECAVQVLADAGFISVWDMTQTVSNILTLPLYPDIDHSFDFTVDWGDGTSEAVTSEYAAHTYEEEGIYAVVIIGTCEGFGFSYANDEANEDNLVDILRWGTVKFHNNGYIFAGCDNLLTFSAADVPDLTGITSLHSVFSRAESFNADLSAWDTSGVTDMIGVFSNARSFNGDISTWNTSNVTDMGSMFFQANAFNGDISSWNTSRVTDMNYMFRLANVFNQDISGWDTGRVTNFNNMFSSAYAFNQDVSSWDTSNAEDMSYMFDTASSFNQDLSSWDVFNVSTMQGMFRYARSYTNGGNPQGLNGWAVTDDCVTTSMFVNCPLSPTPVWY
jgi:surface protein